MTTDTNSNINKLPPNIQNQMNDLIANVVTSRMEIFGRFFDRKRDIDNECGYIPDESLGNMYREFYDRMAIAERVVNVMPMESWQVTPKVYEEEDSDKPTDFEEAWDKLGSQLMDNGKSWFKDEEGSNIWHYLLKADILSGIGSFGIILLGIDDGKNLDQPVDGMPPDGMWKDITGLSQSPTSAQEYEEKDSDDKDDIEDASNDVSDDDTNNNTPPAHDGLGKQFETDDNNDPNDGSPTSKDIYGGDNPNYMYPLDPHNGTDAQYFQTQFSPMSMGGPSAKSKNPKERRLLFMRCFDQSLVQVVQYEANMTNPRFGQPIMYLVTINDPRQPHTGVGLPLASLRVHWSRVIHIAETTDSTSQIFAKPRMRPVINNILDLRKLYGGSAEMYWRGAFPGLSLETHPQLGGDVNVDNEALKEVIANYFSGLDRALLTMGMTAKSLAPQVSDPTAQINVQIEAICIEIKCPIRVFKGSERGELASSQDDSSWNDRLKHRQTLYISPKIIAPFIDRLISLKVLPEPEEYHIEWPDLDKMTDAQKATVLLTRTQAYAAYTSGGLEATISPQDYMTKFDDLTEEEAKSILDMAQKAHENDDTMTMPPGSPTEKPEPPQIIGGVAPGMGGVGGKPMPGQAPIPGLPKPGQPGGIPKPGGSSIPKPPMPKSTVQQPPIPKPGVSSKPQG